MEIAHLLLTIGGIIGGFVSILFILSLLVKRNDIADIFWGVGIFLVALFSFILVTPPSFLTTTLLVLSFLWGARLSLRIFLRNIKRGEDFRYKTWRDTWGVWFYPRSFVQIYLLQGLLMIVVGYPFIHASVYGGGVDLGLLYYIGLCLWSIGYVFEVVGDRQLDRFMSQPLHRGKVLQTGLWKYSRHPNYFGEVTMWWGIGMMVSPLPLGYLALVSPVVITFLILKVSGVPLLEKYFAGNPEFEAYKKRTSVFFPLPPR